MITGVPKYIPEALTGRTLGKYKVMEIIGRGGMGVVYKVWDTLEDKAKAIKMVPPELASSHLAFEDLKREISLASGISHPNVVKVLSLEAQNGQYFIVMEYIEGDSLEKKLAEAPDRKLNEQDILRIMKKTAVGIIEAHAQRIIHRDLKPRNIMESKDGQVKILDFGVSHRMTRSLTELTGQDNIGTWPYMAPEQLSNKFGRENEQVDVWAFGVTMYQLLSGEVPFRNRDQIVDPTEKPFPIEHISRKTHRVVMKCLEKDREKRYRNMQDVLRDLDEISSASSTPNKVKHDRRVEGNEIRIPGKEKKKSPDFARINAVVWVIVAFLFLYYSWNQNHSFGYDPESWNRTGEKTSFKEEYDHYIRQAEDALQKSDYKTARLIVEKAKNMQDSTRLAHLRSQIDARSRLISIKTEIDRILAVMKGEASDEDKASQCRRFLNSYTAIEASLNPDNRTRTRVAQIRSFLEESRIKRIAFTELAVGTATDYSEKLRRIEISGLPPGVSVFGKIKISIRVSDKGRIDVQHIDTTGLSVSDPGLVQSIKASLIKKIHAISLSAPKNKSGVSVHVDAWEIKYKAGAFQNKMFLTVEG
ncbi:MAG: serine/threonine-protein kinase [Candidatus Omnitrophota bacterium]